MNKIFNKIILAVNRAKTIFLYKPFFGYIGRGSVVFKPIFLGNTNKVYIGENVFIRHHARIEVVFTKKQSECSITIQDGVSIEQNFHIGAASNLVIGKNTTISSNVYITDLDHEYKEIGVPILSQPILVNKTTIGDNCFIGLGAKILAGTVLGKQCIIGANSVVRGNYPDYCVLVGSPAKVIKRYNVEKEIWVKTDSLGNF